jgi:hypothetical protein
MEHLKANGLSEGILVKKDVKSSVYNAIHCENGLILSFPFILAHA